VAEAPAPLVAAHHLHYGALSTTRKDGHGDYDYHEAEAQGFASVRPSFMFMGPAVSIADIDAMAILCKHGWDKKQENQNSQPPHVYIYSKTLL